MKQFFRSCERQRVDVATSVSEWETPVHSFTLVATGSLFHSLALAATGLFRLWPIVLLALALTPLPAETLYNGIELPAQWPPNYLGKSYEQFFNDPALKWHAPMPVPYLSH